MISIFVSAILVGWDFYDYPMARRGMLFRARLSYLFKDIWSIMGFGLWMMIPFVQFVLFPLAIAGGTILSYETLKREDLKSSTAA